RLGREFAALARLTARSASSKLSDMHEDPTFKVGTALVRGLRELLERLENRLQLKSPLQVYLTGGMAVHLNA
ncbi:MAG: hypothetical protein ACTHKH_01505, partial [Trinickia sp.]